MHITRQKVFHIEYTLYPTLLVTWVKEDDLLNTSSLFNCNDF